MQARRHSWINPIALNANSYWYYIVFIGGLLIIVYLCFPRPKGEEIASLQIMLNAKLHG